MRTAIRNGCILMTLWAAGPALAQSSDQKDRAATEQPARDKDSQIQELTDRVARLAKTVAQLEQQIAARGAPIPAGGDIAAPEATRRDLRSQARHRAMQDTARYKPEQIREAEALYQPSNDRSRRGSPEVRAALEKLIATYPDLNRAGCAVLYLAQWAQGEQREKLLDDAVRKHGKSFYFDGVQVGPYARFQLGNYYLENHQQDKAKEQFDAIRKETPDAIDHDGNLLMAQIPAVASGDAGAERAVEQPEGMRSSR